MKKILFGVIIGFGLALPISVAGAEVVSLVGKSVQGSFPIKLGEVQVEKDAIVIDGTSYLPVRVVAELFNAEVAFIDDEILITPKGGLYLTDEEAAARSKELADLAAKQQAEMDEKNRLANEKLLEEIEKKKQQEIENFQKMFEQPAPDQKAILETDIKRLSTQRILVNANYETVTDAALKAQLKAELDAIDAQIAEKQAKLAELEAAAE